MAVPGTGRVVELRVVRPKSFSVSRETHHRMEYEVDRTIDRPNPLLDLKVKTL